MVTVLKTVVQRCTGGSNPSSSAVETSVSIKDIGVFLLPNCSKSKGLQTGGFSEALIFCIVWVMPINAD